MSNQAFVVNGGNKLNGEIIPQGAKNEALQVISAVLMTAEPVRIDNIPNILDVRRLISLLKGLGVDVTAHTVNSYTFQAKNIDLNYFSSKEYLEDAKRIRGSVMLMGPLLSRFGKAFLPKPGGDKIGRRRLDAHFHGFKVLGADFQYDAEEDNFYLAAEKLKGGFVHMEEISVTGTANIVMAACFAEGTSTIYNAACEPYLQQLCAMLNRMGAKIEGVASNMLTITGVASLGGTEHRCLPDMIEIGSFMGLAAMTQSKIRIKDVNKSMLGNIPTTFQKIGLDLSFDNDDILINGEEIYEIQNYMDGGLLTIYDAPWPGFTPDLMSILLVTATQAKGSVLIHQKMFESRLFFVDKLIDMGAQIILCDPHRATVIGLERKHPLRGITMSSPDIRAGVSLLIAALSAEGQSTIHNIHQIDRGYQDIEARLQALGADMKRVDA